MNKKCRLVYCFKLFTIVLGYIFYSSLHRPLIIIKNNLLCTYEKIISGLYHTGSKWQTGIIIFIYQSTYMQNQCLSFFLLKATKIHIKRFSN